MSATFGQLNGIVHHLKTAPAPEPSTFRIADWATLSLAIVQALGWDQEKWRKILGKLQTEQEFLALDGDPLVPCLEAWLAAEAQLGRGYSARELLGHLEETANKEGVAWTYKSAASLGKRISHVSDALAKCLDVRIEVTTGRARSKRYWFHKKNGDQC